MRRLAAGFLSAALVAAVVVVLSGMFTPSWAACPPDPVSPTGLCLSDIVNPTDPGDSAPSSGPQGPGPQNCPGAPDSRCVDAYGNQWLGNCYAYMLDPQPAIGSAIWEQIMGDLAEGTVWACVEGTLFRVLGAPPVVDAAGVALQLTERAPFEVAEVHIAPDATFHTYVNVQNWVWVPQNQWHEVSVSLSANGATVTLRAAPSKIDVDMGDGARPLVCRTAGREWRKSMTDAATTSCGYAYKKVSTVNSAGGYADGKRFTVQGRLFYVVDWTCVGNCSGASGTLGEFPAPSGAAQQIEVRQRQTVVTN